MGGPRGSARRRSAVVAGSLPYRAAVVADGPTSSLPAGETVADTRPSASTRGRSPSCPGRPAGRSPGSPQAAVVAATPIVRRLRMPEPGSPLASATDACWHASAGRRPPHHLRHARGGRPGGPREPPRAAGDAARADHYVLWPADRHAAAPPRRRAGRRPALPRMPPSSAWGVARHAAAAGAPARRGCANATAAARRPWRASGPPSRSWRGSAGGPRHRRRVRSEATQILARPDGAFAAAVPDAADRTQGDSWRVSTSSSSARASGRQPRSWPSAARQRSIGIANLSADRAPSGLPAVEGPPPRGRIHAVGGDYPWSRAAARRDWMSTARTSPTRATRATTADSPTRERRSSAARPASPGPAALRSAWPRSRACAGRPLPGRRRRTHGAVPAIPGLDQVTAWSNREATSTRDLPRSPARAGLRAEWRRAGPGLRPLRGPDDDRGPPSPQLQGPPAQLRGARGRPGR